MIDPVETGHLFHNLGHAAEHFHLEGIATITNVLVTLNLSAWAFEHIWHGTKKVVRVTRKIIVRIRNGRVHSIEATETTESESD